MANIVAGCLSKSGSEPIRKLEKLLDYLDLPAFKICRSVTVGRVTCDMRQWQIERSELTHSRRHFGNGQERFLSGYFLYIISF
jgi:hypothetical protein